MSSAFNRRKVVPRRRRALPGLLPSHPPPIAPQVAYSQRLRFICTTAAVNKVINFFNLLDTIGVATTAVAGFELFDQVRLGFVELWSLPAIGTSTQVSVQFSGAIAGALGDGHVHSDNSMGIEPAHVLARPALSSQTAQWQVASNSTAFLLTCPVGSVIDVSLSYRVLSAVAPTGLTTALVGATIGDIIYRGLDSLALAGTTLPAQAPVTN